MFVLCLFDRKSNQSVVWLSAAWGNDHPFHRLIEGAGAKTHRSQGVNVRGREDDGGLQWLSFEEIRQLI
jgi:hypothetical protein